MRILVYIVLVGFIVSCQPHKKEEQQVSIGQKPEVLSPFKKGEKIFKGKGKCYTCHKIDKKSIGPSMVSIAEIYRKEKGDLIGFMKQEKPPIVDPENYAVMKTNFSIIKTFTEEELKFLETYMIAIGNEKK